MTVTPHPRSGSDGGAATGWRKSSRSTGLEACVEIRHTESRVMIRDSKDPDGPRLLIEGHAWSGFIAGLPTPPGSPG